MQKRDLTASSSEGGCSRSNWTAERGEKWLAGALHMEAMLAPVNEHLISALRLETPVRVADLGCGSGKTALAIARSGPVGLSVDGFDIASGSIALANQEDPVPERNLSFAVLDVANTLPPQGPYDRLVSRFGVMFFDDPLAAFTNLARWLTSNGRFAFAVWGEEGRNLWMSMVRSVVEQYAPLPKPLRDAPGPFRYADGKKFLELLVDAGFQNVELHTWEGLLPAGTGLKAQEAAHFALSSFSSFSEALTEVGPTAFARAHESLTTTFAAHERHDGVWLGAQVHIVTGTGGASSMDHSRGGRQLSTSFTLETARCRLQIPSEEEFPYVFSASRVEGFNDGMLWDPPASIEELREPLMRSLEAWKNGSAYAFSIYSKDPFVFVGRISIRKSDRDGVWDIGFWTHPTQQGRGYMTEAAKSVLQFGFQQLNADRIEACHATWNKDSERLLKRIGMSFVAHVPQGFKKRGEWVAEDILAIDRAEWASHQ